MATVISQYAGKRWVEVAEACVEAGEAENGMVPGCAMAVVLLGVFMKSSVGIAMEQPEEGAEVSLSSPTHN